MSDEDTNFENFRDCVFSVITEKSTSKLKKPKTSRQHRTQSTSTTGPESTTSTADDIKEDPSDLADFSDYIATLIFDDLPLQLRTLSYHTLREDTSLSETWSIPLTLTSLEAVAADIAPSVSDSLTTYNLITPPNSDLSTFLSPILVSYINITSAPPPYPSTTRLTHCEMCDRDWVPLTYHHLIPKQVHAKVLKRGWHEESQLGNVAWLCRACHSFVHKMAGNEELAREWFTIERVLEREDVRRWAAWVGRVRWRKR